MVDSAVRNNIVKPHRRETLPTNLMNIQKFAWRRSKISLQFLPQVCLSIKIIINKTKIKFVLQMTITIFRKVIYIYIYL